jgi:xylan 1,4-beta-xylosidase
VQFTTRSGLAGRLFPLISFCVAPIFAATFDVAVDASKSWGALPHFWSCFGTGHYGLFYTHPELKDHLKDAVVNLGMNKIRSHGFLHDDIGIYHEVNGQPEYSWARADSIIDFLLSIGIRPIMEFGSMPRDLASNPNATMFKWNQGVSPPNDFTAWENLIKEFVSHYKTRYGAEEIEKWRFEVWNEPELGMFWSGNQAQYQQLYKATVQGATAAHAKVKVGGSSPSGPYRFDWITSLLNYCKTNNLPIGCVTYHTWNIGDCRTGHFGALDIINKFDPTLESIDTEWGPTYVFNVGYQPQETTQGALCAVDVICSIARRCFQESKKLPWAYSWWVVSDVFEENGWDGYRDNPMNSGGMGLISRQGLHKPAYNAFKMLNMMGTTQISINSTPNGSVNGMATIKSDSTVHVILYNSFKDYGVNEGNERPPAGSDDVTLTISNVPFSKVDYRCMVVDGEHSNAYAAWLDMGKPNVGAMNDEKWKTLRTAMVLDTVDSANSLQIINKTFTRTFTLRKEGVMLISLAPPPGSVAHRQIAAAEKKVDPGIRAVCINGRLHLRAANEQAYSFELIAPTGRALKARKGVRGSCSIPTTGMGPGVYVVKLTTPAGRHILKQVIIAQQ